MPEWVVRALLRRASTAVARSPSDALPLRTILQRIDRMRTGEVSAEQLLIELSDAFDGLCLARPMRNGGARLTFHRRHAQPVGVEHISQCFAVWNGGGKGTRLRYADNEFRAVWRMLGRDGMPRGRHVLGASSYPAGGRYIPDVAATGLHSSDDIGARRFHDYYYSTRQHALQLQALHPTEPLDLGTTRKGLNAVQVVVSKDADVGSGVQPGEQFDDVRVLSIRPPRIRSVLVKGGSVRVATRPSTVRAFVPGLGIRDVVGAIEIASPRLLPISSSDSSRRNAKTIL